MKQAGASFAASRIAHTRYALASLLNIYTNCLFQVYVDILPVLNPQGETSIFPLESSPIGTIEAMTLSHDGSGPHPDWKVVKVLLLLFLQPSSDD